MKKVISILLCLSIFLGCSVGAMAATPRYQELSSTYEDVWIENDEICFWAYAIPWEPTSMTIKLRVQENVGGQYRTVVNASANGTGDHLEILRTIPYSADRYFKITIDYIVGPDHPVITKYFYT